METRIRLAATVNAAGSGWCHWHCGSSETAELIQYGERSSGPSPLPLYACALCREQRRIASAAIGRVP